VATEPVLPEHVSGHGSMLFSAHSGERLRVMRTSALFAELSQSEMLELAGCARSKAFERNEVLFMQGQPLRQVILLESGSVKLTQLSPGGSEVILWLNGTGDSVGLTGALSHGRHSCSARAVVRSRAIMWEWSRLQVFSESMPKIRRNMGAILSDRLVELEERFREIATEKVSRRVALALLRIVKHVGKESTAAVEVALSREELAQLTGTTLFTISRLMSRWNEQGIVLPRREAVLILDPVRLSAVSERGD
jgi:CRP-like cAMP-binding protein